MDIKDCVMGAAVRLAGSRKDSRDRECIICGIIQGVDAKQQLVDVGFGYFTRSEHDWRKASELELLPEYKRRCRTPAEVQPPPPDAKIMVAAMTPDDQLLAVGFCGDAVAHRLYDHFQAAYNVPSDVSWGIHGDHREVASWIGYRTVQVYVVPGAGRDSIELVPCFSQKPPYEELAGPWRLD